MYKIQKILIRIHEKSMEFREKSAPWESQVARIGFKGSQGTAKGKPRSAKVLPRRAKGSPGGTKRGPREQNEVIGAEKK